MEVVGISPEFSIFCLSNFFLFWQLCLSAPHNQQHIHNANMHPPQIPMQQQPQQNAMPNHGRPHSHTPPHQYQAAVQVRQAPPIQQQPHAPKPQMNGEAKPVPQRQQRNVYNQNQQQYQHDMKNQEVVNVPSHPPRHREDAVKELHAFSQDFKLVPPQNEQQVQGPPPVMEQVSCILVIAPLGCLNFVFLRKVFSLQSHSVLMNSLKRRKRLLVYLPDRFFFF